MSRVPLRVRVAAAFAAAMAVVLTATGVFLYQRLGDDLARSLDQDLRLRAQDLSALVRAPDGSLATESGGRLVERGESFAELLARLRALTRRGEAERPAVLTVDDLRLDPATREVTRGSTAIDLS
ncbi:MAG: hypothetical protein ACJ768_10990, partial [Gaiellaceae bacterium]